MTWKTIINDEQQKEYYQNLEKFIDKRYQETQVYPKK